MSLRKRWTWGRANFRAPWKGERGFSLIEAMAATFIVGTVLVGTVLILGATANTSSRSRAGVELQDLVRTQIELIMQSPFKLNPADYPRVTDLPGGVTMTFTSTDTDPKTTYSFPAPVGTTLTGVIQQIAVRATKGADETVMIFYKIRSP